MYANLFPSEHPEPGPIEYAGNRFKSKLLAQRSNFCTAIQTPFLQHHLNIRFLRSKFVKKYNLSIFLLFGDIILQSSALYHSITSVRSRAMSSMSLM